MADQAAASAATVLTGNAAGAAAGGDAAAGAGGAGAGTGAGAAGGAAAGAGGAAAGGGAASAPWYGDLANPDLKTFAETKQFKDPTAALEAYRNLERMVGVPADQLIRKPKDANDAEGMKAFRTALGVPDAAEKYELPIPGGEAGSDFSKWAASTFLDAGIPKDAAHAIVAKWNEFAGGMEAQMEKQAQTEFANGMVQLKDQWGGAYDQRVELAKRALRTFGKEIGINEIGDNAFKDLERAAGGGVQLIKLLAAVGARTTEDTFQGGERQTFTMSAEQATAKIAELKADKAWASAYLGGDKNKQAEMQKLMEISLQTAK